MMPEIRDYVASDATASKFGKGLLAASEGHARH